MLYLKACPRCDGDVHVNRDVYGEYRQCLQCGYTEDTERPQGVRVIPVPKVKLGTRAKAA